MEKPHQHAEEERARIERKEDDVVITSDDSFPASDPPSWTPVSGVVSMKSVEVGQIVQPGQGLMTIVPLHDVWITANFKETQLAKVRPGQKAEVHVDMYDATIEGRVDSIAGATGARTSLLPPENATGNFVKVVQRIPVKIVFDRLPRGIVLRPGMNVAATILTK
ncbi:MAG: HlyD family efflux transporter periplasmic adaptor subunit [Acidobacteriia bacterium]|nr:HlyD family efflux transporter periplasmic adaptor subunit [Terriglobia bacterium]